VLKSRIPTTALTSPNNVAIVGGNKSLVVTWSPPTADVNGLYGGSALLGYQIAYSIDRTNWTNIASTVTSVSPNAGYVAATTQSYTINGLKNNTLYYVKIYSVNKSTPKASSSSTSTFPAIASGNTFLLPSKPLSVAVTGDGVATIVNGLDKTNLIATWSAPASDGGAPIISYRVQYSADKDVWTTLDAVIGSSDLVYNSATKLYTYRFTGPNELGLNKNAILTKSTYYVRISAVNIVVSEDGYASPFSVTLPVKTLNVPSSVTGVTISSGTRVGTVLLAWNPPADNGGSAIQAYSVSYYKTTDSLKSTVFAGSTTLTKYTISGLDSANQYYTFQISALNGTYTSTPYEVTGRANTKPGVPVGLKVVVVNGEFVLSFVIDDTGGSQITMYVVSVSPTKEIWDEYEYEAASTQSVGAVQLKLSTSKLVSGSGYPVFATKRLYYFKVAARNALFPTEYGTFTSSDVSGKIIVVPNQITDTRVYELTRDVLSISPVTGQFVSTTVSYLLLTWGWGTDPVLSSDIGGDDEGNVGYILEYSITEGNFKIWTRFNGLSNLITERTLAFADVKPDTTYFFRIYAINTAGSSVASISMNITTKSAV
jgi:hypothetical protein